MSETVNQETKTMESSERTFTQSEMDAIIGERLARERAKYADYDTMKQKAEQFDAAEEASKSELQKATERAEALQKQVDAMLKADTARQIRDKVAKETGVPAHLLTAETEEACAEQAKAIMAFAQPSGYPAVKDAGEVTKKTKGNAQEEFAEWFKQVQK